MADSNPTTPSGVTFTHGADETSVTVAWEASTAQPVATAFLVQWALVTPDTPNPPTSWTGSQTVTASPAVITGLAAGSSYVIQIVAQAVQGGTTLSATPYSTTITMLPVDVSQDSFYSVYVPAQTVTSYIRLGPPDLSSVEPSLLAQWNDTIAVAIPASDDLGPTATTGAVLYSTKDVGILSTSKIRLRTPGNVLEYSAGKQSTTSKNTTIVKTRDAAGDAKGSGIVTFTSTDESLGSWWTTKYDRSYALSWTENTAGTFKIAETYDFSTGFKFANAFSSGLDTKVNAVDVTAAFTGMKVELGWTPLDGGLLAGTLKTTLAGEEQKFGAKAGLTAGTINLVLSDETDLVMNASLKKAAAVMIALSAVITLFGLTTSAVQWGYLATADSSTPTTLQNFLNTTAVPFFLTAQAANAVMFLIGVALGIKQILIRKASPVTKIAGTQIAMGDLLLNSAFVNVQGKYINLQNSAMYITMSRSQIALGSLPCAVYIDRTGVLMKTTAGDSKLDLDSTGGATLSSQLKVSISSALALELKCGASSIKLDPTGAIDIAGTSLKFNGLQVQVN